MMCGLDWHYYEYFKASYWTKCSLLWRKTQFSFDSQEVCRTASLALEVRLKVRQVNGPLAFVLIGGAGNGLWCGKLKRVSCATDGSPEKPSNASCKLSSIPTCRGSALSQWLQGGKSEVKWNAFRWLKEIRIVLLLVGEAILFMKMWLKYVSHTILTHTI